MKKIKSFLRADNQEVRTGLIIVLCFGISVLLRGILIDYPKAMQVYPDELRYLESARSLFQGKGLLVHNEISGFQNVLYSIVIMPALFFKDKIIQMRVICWIHAVLVSSAIFPTYCLARRIIKDKKTIYLIIGFFLTVPTLATSSFFMSEIVFLPVSLYVVYFVWRVIEEEIFEKRLQLNFCLGILMYLAYLTKEVALYLPLAYIISRIIYTISCHKDLKKECICLGGMLAGFVISMLLFNLILFKEIGNPHSYYSTGIQAIMSIKKFLYFCFASLYNLCIVILGFGVFPVLISVTTNIMDRNGKHGQLVMFLLLSVFIACVTIAYMISIREDFPSRSPRKHLRYLEPLFIPFVIEMVFCLSEVEKNITKRISVGLLLYSIIFILTGYSVNSGALVDNTLIKYFDYLLKLRPVRLGMWDLSITTQLLLLRFSLVCILEILFIIFCKSKAVFKRSILLMLMGLNLLNTKIVYQSASATYKITDLKENQINEVSKMLPGLDGNILLVTNVGIDDATKLFDTYVDHSKLYYASLSSLIDNGTLEDGVIDLNSEYISNVVVPQQKLNDADYLIAKDDVIFGGDSVKEILDFPLENYKLYKNNYREKIYLKPIFPLKSQSETFIRAEDNRLVSQCATKYVADAGGQLVIYASGIPISKGKYTIKLRYEFDSDAEYENDMVIGVLQIGNYLKGNIINQELTSGKNEVVIQNVDITENMFYGEIKMYSYLSGLKFNSCSIGRME